jgi:hypothetical protein
MQPIIDDTKPTVQEIADARENITSSPQAPTDESLLEEIKIALNTASDVEHSSLAQVQDGSHQYLVDSVKKTMEDTKISEKSQRDSMVAASVRAEVDLLIESAKPRVGDIVNTQTIVNTANENATDPDLLENARITLEKTNEEVQNILDGEIDQETLEQLQQLLIITTDRAKTLRDTITEIPNETQDDVLEDVILKQQKTEIQTRLNTMVKEQRTWFQKNLVWIIIVSVTVTVSVLAAIGVYVKNRTK